MNPEGLMSYASEYLREKEPGGSAEPFILWDFSVKILHVYMYDISYILFV